MSTVTFDIDPSLPKGSGEALPLNETLPYDAFDPKVKYRSRYLLEDQQVDYGESELYNIYVDVCHELDKLEAGGSHDLEMSFYPVLRVEDMGNGFIKLDNVSEVSPEPRIRPVIVTRTSLLDQLVSSKTRIEEAVIDRRFSRTT